MIRPWNLIRRIIYPETYIWVGVIYIAETRKAILIVFDGQKAWIPKAWIARFKYNKNHYVIASLPKAGEAISIKISEYHWAKKVV